MVFRRLVLTQRQRQPLKKQGKIEQFQIHLVCSLQWLPSLDKYSILSSNASAHHDSSWGGQAKSAGACNGQHCYTDLKGEGEHKLCLVILAGLRGKKYGGLDIQIKKQCELPAK